MHIQWELQGYEAFLNKLFLKFGGDEIQHFLTTCISGGYLDLPSGFDQVFTLICRRIYKIYIAKPTRNLRVRKAYKDEQDHTKY